MTEHVYQCAKVARSAPSQEINRDHTTDETRAEPIKTETAPETQNKSAKENIAAALLGFLNMGMYVCGPSKEDPMEEVESHRMRSTPIIQEEEKSDEKIDITSIEEDYIFEDKSTEDGHIGASVTIHVITEAERSHLPSPLKPIYEEEKEEARTRLNDDIFEFSDAETLSSDSSPIAPTQDDDECQYEQPEEEECQYEQKQEEKHRNKKMQEELQDEKPQEECLWEQSHGPQSQDSFDSFDLVESDFYGSKGHWNTGPRIISPTRCEV